MTRTGGRDSTVISGEAVEEISQHRCIGFALRPGDRVPLPPEAPLPLLAVGRVVRHAVELALVLAKAGHDATGDRPTVDGDPDLLVRYAAHVVRLPRVERVQP